MELIAEREASKGLLFWYFRSKDELIAEVARGALLAQPLRAETLAGVTRRLLARAHPRVPYLPVCGN